ncbi:cob(I)yrinic acid a,c-diamide adenosyltransferase [Candidatus Uhrbacteria bacterium]|nr:cob(I)yrinic acid a,c-diamide adenosyltransferase [Candidatus Uhrbacteria bacterium]
MGTPDGKTPGMVHVYTGNGKGKTTAALGLALRAVGAGKRVGIVFFDKGGERYSERKALDRLKPDVEYWVTGSVRADFSEGGRFRFGNGTEDLAEARRGLDLAGETVADPRFDLVILDEAVTAVRIGLLGLEGILALIEKKRPESELVLTGRGAFPDIIGLADLVSEINDTKHYFREGTPAREGIDY